MLGAGDPCSNVDTTRSCADAREAWRWADTAVAWFGAVLSGALSLRSIRSSGSVVSGIKPRSHTPARAYAHDIEVGESRYSKLRLHTPKVSHQPLRQTPLPIPHGASAHVQSYHRRARCSRNTEAQCSAPETRARTLIRPAAVRTLARHGAGPEASMTVSNDLRHF